MSRSWVVRLALRSPAFALAAVFAIVAPGCSSRRPGQREVFPVKGQLFVDKKPAVGAVVWLHSVELLNSGANPATLAAEPRPCGIVQADGSFVVSTYDPGDGAPIGRYRLAIFWTKNTGPGDSGGANLLPARYQNPNNPSLPVVEVKRESNVLPPLYLTAR